MSWQTDLFTNITFNRKTYNSLGEVESDYDKVCNMIKHFEGDLRSLALITEPKKFCDEEQDPLWFLKHKVEECLEELEDLYVEKYKLELLISEWNHCHNEEGYAIPRPENIHWNSSFLDGDFVKTKENKDDFID